MTKVNITDYELGLFWNPYPRLRFRCRKFLLLLIEVALGLFKFEYCDVD
jgi:hypothetical protein